MRVKKPNISAITLLLAIAPACISVSAQVATLTLSSYRFRDTKKEAQASLDILDLHALLAPRRSSHTPHKRAMLPAREDGEAVSVEDFSQEHEL